MDRFTIVFVLLSVYLVVSSFWQVQGATKDEITVGEGPARRTISQLSYPELVTVDGLTLRDPRRKRGGGSWGRAHLRNHGHPQPTPGGQVKEKVVVDRNGSGEFRTVSEAVDRANMPGWGSGRFHIHVKAGEYHENVHVRGSNVMITGEGIGSTIITGNKHFDPAKKMSIADTATFAVSGNGFIAKDITIRNTAGPHKNQSVALHASSDSVFFRCSLEGFQDTLYAQKGRQFYRDCHIYGTIDFIFGDDASAIFQNCKILVRRPLDGQKNTVTAQGRRAVSGSGAIVIQGSSISAAPELKPVMDKFKTYLGRPWKAHSRTVIVNTYLGELIDPAGWLEWNNHHHYGNSVYYAEYKNKGPGADTRNRVRWRGYHAITKPRELADFSYENLFGGHPPPGIPVTYKIV